MEVQHVQLVQGRFGVEEARRLVSHAFACKFKQHTRRLQERNGSLEDVAPLDAVSRKLEEELSRLLQFIGKVEAEGGRIDLESTITVRKA